MKSYNLVEKKEVVKKTIVSLKNNGIEAFFVDSGKEAKKKVFELVPKGASVMNMTSMTLDSIGVSLEILDSGNYVSVRKRLMSMDRKKDNLEMQMMGAAPEFVVGSVHTVTQDGKLMFASRTGSQLAAYVYGSPNVVFVVGTQKIVKDFEEGLDRIYKYALPLEEQRVRKFYGVGSEVNKILIINKELVQGRIKLIFVNEVLGF